MLPHDFFSNQSQAIQILHTQDTCHRLEKLNLRGTAACGPTEDFAITLLLIINNVKLVNIVIG